MFVNHRQQHKVRTLDDEGLECHRCRALHQQPQQPEVGHEVAKVGAAKRNWHVAPIERHHQRKQRKRIGQQRANRHARDTKCRQTERAGQQDRRECQSQSDPEQGEAKRCLGIAGASQRHHHHDIDEHARHLQADQPQVGNGGIAARLGNMHAIEQHRREHPACRSHQHPEGCDRGDRGANHSPHRLGIPRTDRLPDGDTCCKPDAHHRAHHHVHEDVRVHDRGQGIVAQNMADPDRVPGTRQRMQEIGEQQRQREADQRRRYRPLEELCLTGGQSGIQRSPSWRARPSSTSFSRCASSDRLATGKSA